VPEAPNQGTFRISLAMAGAVSAGAYTAGVLDFLIEALDEWQKAKDENRKTNGDDTASWDVPSHDVDLHALVGSSAGGICAALMSTILRRPHSPVRTDDPDAIQPLGFNCLYDTWVHRADIDPLLGKNDLQGPKAQLSSLLDSTALDDIAQKAIVLTGMPLQRAYTPDPVQIILTLGNLRGVTYEIALSGSSTIGAADGHDMTVHGDTLEFYVASQANPAPQTPGHDPDLAAAQFLDPGAAGSPAWVQLVQAALGTSAFPVGLAARSITCSTGPYGLRLWEIPRGNVVAPPLPPPPATFGRWLQSGTIPPKGPQPGQATWQFVAVDGGITNNEPFDIARRCLLDRSKPGDSLPRDPAAAHSAVILVDPFPDPVDPASPYDAKTDLVSVVAQLIEAWIQQARFKPDELVLAQDESVFSRFLIAPIRRDQPGGVASRHPLASGSLGGFGGFLERTWRNHDFHLGRLNCQRFLRNGERGSFALLDTNPLFSGWRGGKAGSDPQFFHFDSDPSDPAAPYVKFRPIVPLVGTAARDLKPPTWPGLTPSARDQFLDALMPKIERRFDAIADFARAAYLSGAVASIAGFAAWKLVRGKLIDAVRGAIRKSVSENEIWGA